MSPLCLGIEASVVVVASHYLVQSAAGTPDTITRAPIIQEHNFRVEGESIPTELLWVYRLVLAVRDGEDVARGGTAIFPNQYALVISSSEGQLDNLVVAPGVGGLIGRYLQPELVDQSLANMRWWAAADDSKVAAGNQAKLATIEQAKQQLEVKDYWQLWQLFTSQLT